MPARVVALLLVVAPPLTAQWRAWNVDRPNYLALGLGANVGGVGVRYARALGDTPLLAGAGLGVAGFGPFLEIALARESDEFDGRQPFFGAGLWVGRDGRLADNGSFIVEVGYREWLPADGRMFFELGLGLVRPLWGNPNLGVLGLAFPRAQFGVAF